VSHPKVSESNILGFPRSTTELNEYEMSEMTTTFEKFDIDNKNSINYEELKPFFLHINIVMHDELLNEYIKGCLRSSKSDTESGDKENNYIHSQTLSKEQVLDVFRAILSNQSEYYRAIYNKVGSSHNHHTV